MPSFSHIIATFISSTPLFLRGMLLTVELTTVSTLMAIVIGLIFAFFKLSPLSILRHIANGYIYFVRGTPLIVQIFILYFGLTRIIQLDNFWAACLALAFHTGAYIAEIFRGAIESIEKGQYEAARSLGMNVPLTYRRIILPQAFLRALPSLGNQFIIGLKDSSLAAFISMDELFNIATTLGANNFDQMTYLIIVAFYYLILVLVVTLIVHFLERKLKRGVA